MRSVLLILPCEMNGIRGISFPHLQSSIRGVRVVLELLDQDTCQTQNKTHTKTDPY